jgi:hypothetical protein
MKYCSFCKQTKAITEFYKNKNRKDGYYIHCKQCKQIADKKTYQKHKEQRCSKVKEYKNRNKEKALKAVRVSAAKWRKENKDKNAAKSTRYRASKLQATPSWLTKEHNEQIESFYWLSKLQKELTDDTYHVDHIVPLKGKTVCGLHVPWNLQILKATDNIKKGNKYGTI